MPVYAYKCQKCEYAFKLFHQIDEIPGKCPKCSNDSLNKQFLPNNNMKLVSNKDDPGKRIEKFIEESKESLREQIEESRKDYIK